MRAIELLIITLLSAIVLVLSFYPILYRYQTTPSDRVYVGTEFFTQDYAGYVSTINQGRKGEWLYKDKFTNENLPRTILYYPYLLIGQLARLININAIVTYHLSRLILALIYLFLTFKLIKLFFPQDNQSDSFKRIISFIIILFSSAFPNALSTTTAEIQVFTRYLIQPHYLLGNILLLYLVFTILARKYSFWPLFFLTFFRPSHSLFFLLALTMYAAYRRQITFLIKGIIFTLPGFIYLYFLKTKFPFLPYFSYDLGQANVVSVKDFVLSLGLPGLLAVIGLYKSEEKTRVLYFYLLSILICLFVLSSFLPFNSLRFIQTPTFIIVGLLACLAIFKLKNIFLVLASCFLILLSSLPPLISDFNHQVKLYYDAYYIWPPRKYLESFSYLEKNSKPDDVVLTHQSLSNLVPMFSGNTVFWGHTNETLDYENKKIRVERFYRGEMTEEEAKNFLSKNSIKYVLVGREEKFLGWKGYVFLKKVFGNEEIEIYLYP